MFLIIVLSISSLVYFENMVLGIYKNYNDYIFLVKTTLLL